MSRDRPVYEVGLRCEFCGAENVIHDDHSHNIGRVVSYACFKCGGSKPRPGPHVVEWCGELVEAYYR